MRLYVGFALRGRVRMASLERPAVAIVSEAFTTSGFSTHIAGFDFATLAFAVWGRPVTATTLLRDGDRLELLRPLLADPKLARRRRAERNG